MSSSNPADEKLSSAPDPLPNPHVPLFQPSRNDRLSLPFGARLATATFLSITTGALLGLSHGSQATALRFRAENSHRLPASQRGWYFYHKSKNYAVMLGGFREARRMGVKLGSWTAIFFVVEDVVDAGRAVRAEDWGQQRPSKDALSTICAAVTTAAAFSLWNGLPLATTAPMARLGLGVGLAYGIAQDVINGLRGRRVGYVEWVKRATGINHRGANENSA